MKSKRVQRIGYWVAFLLLVSLAAAACAPDATTLIISPRLGDQLAALEEGDEVVAAVATEAPKLSDIAPEEITVGLPEDVLAALESADPAGGEQIALTRGCIGCHSLDPSMTMTGPTWYHVGDTAVSRVAGESPALYLYESIINPNAFVVPNYPANIMPANYKDLLTTEELATLVSYLLQQNDASGG